MKTYTESRDKDLFDWNLFLNKSHISNEEWLSAAELSSSWVTCACGTQCAIIPRGKSGSPNDYPLWQLGLTFHETIKAKDAHWAKILLERIERRSAELITELQLEC